LRSATSDLEPLATGNVAGKRASGTVPEANALALSPVSALPSVAEFDDLISGELDRHKARRISERCADDGRDTPNPTGWYS